MTVWNWSIAPSTRGDNGDSGGRRRRVARWVEAGMGVASGRVVGWRGLGARDAR